MAVSRCVGVKTHKVLCNAHAFHYSQLTTRQRHVGSAAEHHCACHERLLSQAEDELDDVAVALENVQR